MADIKESAMAKAADGAYIRALDVSGNSILISKADLAELMRANMIEATTEKKGLLSNSLFSKVLFANTPYRINRNSCVKIGQLSGISNARRFTILATGASHYGTPATYLVEYGSYQGRFYSIRLTTGESWTDTYFGEILIKDNDIYMKSNNYVDDFTVSVLDSKGCDFLTEQQNVSEPTGAMSSRDVIYKLIN